MQRPDRKRAAYFMSIISIELGFEIFGGVYTMANVIGEFKISLEDESKETIERFIKAVDYLIERDKKNTVTVGPGYDAGAVAEAIARNVLANHG